MNAKIILTLLFVISGALLCVFLLRSESPTELPLPTVLSAPPAAELSAELSQSAAESAAAYRGERVPIVAEEAEPVAEAATAVAGPVPFTVRGRVLDAEKNPVPGVDVWQLGDEEEVASRSGPGGWFEFETINDFGRLEALRDGWVTVLNGSFRRERPFEPLVVIAPAMDLTGRVVDVNGRGLLDAGVALEIPTTFATHFGERAVIAKSPMRLTHNNEERPTARAVGATRACFAGPQTG